MTALPAYIGRLANTPDAQRYCARTGAGIGFDSHRLNEPKRLPRISFGALLLIASLAVIVAALTTSGIIDRTAYATPSLHTQER